GRFSGGHHWPVLGDRRGIIRRSAPKTSRSRFATSFLKSFRSMKVELRNMRTSVDSSAITISSRPPDARAVTKGIRANSRKIRLYAAFAEWNHERSNRALRTADVV